VATSAGAEVSAGRQQPGWHRRVRAGSDLMAPLAAVLVVLGLWELVVRTGLISETSIPTMTATVGELFTQLGESGFWSAVGKTLEGWALGLGIAMALGIPLGMLIGSSRWLFRAFRVPIEFLRPIPSVALIPLAVLIYGTGLESKVFLAAFASFWPLLIQTIYGVQDVDPVATDTAKSFGLGRPARVRHITLPSAVPYIATGVRISSAVSLILVVTAELVIGAAGLGREINTARSGGNVEVMYALILATGLLGYVLNLLMTRVERRVLRWHPSHRAVAA
jgi:ABC-type nitrate/sulfonate/bicarbonate transport system permease component